MKHIIAFLFCSLPAFCAITRVGSAIANTTTYMQNSVPNSTVTTGTVNTGTGGLTVACVRWYNPGTEAVSGVTDTAGNTYAQLAAKTTYSGTSVQCFAAVNTTANANNAVSFNMSTGVIYAWAFQIHYSGLVTTSVVDALDVYASKTHASGTSITSDAFTTAQADEVIIAVADVADLAGTFSATSPLTLVTPSSSYNVGGAGDEIVSSIQSSATRQMTSNSSSGKIMLLFSLKAPASSPAVQKRRPVVFQ